jgi:hypothetical protein
MPRVRNLRLEPEPQNLDFARAEPEPQNCRKFRTLIRVATVADSATSSCLIQAQIFETDFLLLFNSENWIPDE